MSSQSYTCYVERGHLTIIFHPYQINRASPWLYTCALFYTSVLASLSDVLLSNAFTRDVVNRTRMLLLTSSSFNQSNCRLWSHDHLLTNQSQVTVSKLLNAKQFAVEDKGSTEVVSSAFLISCHHQRATHTWMIVSKGKLFLAFLI